MRMCEDYYDDLWEMEWVQIPGVPYVVKYKFDDVGYTVMITDLSVIYGEKLNELEVQERFCNINPYAEMKSKVIIKHMKQSIEDCLANKDIKIKLQCTPQNLTIRLQFSVSQVFFIFDLRPQVLPAEKLRTHLIAPTLLTSLYIHQENATIKQKIEEIEKRDSFSLPSQKTKEDQKIKVIQSRMNKRSKVPVSEILESFLHMQKCIKHCILESQSQKDCIAFSEQSSSSVYHLSGANSSPLKETAKDGCNVLANVKYEDEEESATDEEEPDLSTSNTLQQSKFSTSPQKRDVSDLTKHESDNQSHARTKKKRSLRF